ncbi:MAG: chromate transporter [Verrucomicrobiales bacterium]|nr:chromate transporter [Verrucomicrobiales bacterium]
MSKPSPILIKNAPSFREAFRFWLKLGFISFGGPAGQIAIMHTELVQNKKWIDEARFLHALNYCMLLPGPEATQLAIYIGWLLHRTAGGIIAGTLFVLPSMVILWSLSMVYVHFGNVPWIVAFFYGLKPAVLAIVAAAVLKLGKKALRNEWMWCLAALAFVALFVFKLPFPAVVAASAIIGLLGGRFWPKKFGANLLHIANADEASGTSEPAKTIHDHTRPSLPHAVRVISVSLFLWFLPMVLVVLSLGQSHSLFREAVFFSKAAMVTFGGAYAVLPYVGTQAVETYHWLEPGQMLDGLALAETTPGPLIMVLQFVGFLGAYHQPGGISPWIAGTFGAFITTWCTFVPCFLWILLGAPHIEQLRGNKKLNSALTAVTAAIVGVILNLAVWFALHTLFQQGDGKLDLFSLTITGACLFGLLRWNWKVIPVIIATGLLGICSKILSVL